MEVAYAGKRVPMVMWTFMMQVGLHPACTDLVAHEHGQRGDQAPRGQGREVRLGDPRERRPGQRGKPSASTRGVSRNDRPSTATQPRCSRVMRARRAVARARPVAFGDRRQRDSAARPGPNAVSTGRSRASDPRREPPHPSSRLTPGPRGGSVGAAELPWALLTEHLLHLVAAAAWKPRAARTRSRIGVAGWCGSPAQHTRDFH